MVCPRNGASRNGNCRQTQIGKTKLGSINEQQKNEKVACKNSLMRKVRAKSEFKKEAEKLRK